VMTSPIMMLLLPSLLPLLGLVVAGTCSSSALSEPATASSAAFLAFFAALRTTLRAALRADFADPSSIWRKKWSAIEVDSGIDGAKSTIRVGEQAWPCMKCREFFLECQQNHRDFGRRQHRRHHDCHHEKSKIDSSGAKFPICYKVF